MAHNPHTKAQAMALLMLGNTPRYVSAQLGVPRTTVRRWRVEARAWARELFGDALAGALAAIGDSDKMALKKGEQ
jgi:transposase-like protein